MIKSLFMNWVKIFTVLTYNIELQLPGETWCSGNDDAAEVTARVGLLSVVDVDGEVGGRHRHSKANTFPEFRTSNPDLSWGIGDDLQQHSKQIE